MKNGLYKSRHKIWPVACAAFVLLPWRRYYFWQAVGTGTLTFLLLQIVTHFKKEINFHVNFSSVFTVLLITAIL